MTTDQKDYLDQPFNCGQHLVGFDTTEELSKHFAEEHTDHQDELDDFVEAYVDKKVREARDKYEELILAVGNKYEGETRHETALRYIKQAENSSDNTALLEEEE